jgi:membrane-anchored protein YejM (alkaline phosphatase superfamily)
VRSSKPRAAAQGAAARRARLSLDTPEPRGRILRRAVVTFAALDCAAAVLQVEFSHFPLASAGLTLAGRAYLAATLATQAALLAVVVALPALAVTLFPRLDRAAVILAPLGAVALHAFLAVDGLLLGILGMHVNRAVLEVALAPDGIASLEVQPREWLRVGLFLVVLAAAAALAIALSLRVARAGRGRRIGRVLALTVVLLFASDRVAYAVAPLVHWREPVRAAASLPLHDLEASLSVRLEPQRFHYPRAPLRYRPLPSPPSILWIVVESWRADALDPEQMPAVWRWSRKATRFLDHRSGGNWTYAGVTSQFYGLHATYASAAQEAKRGPVIIDRAMELGYELKVIASRGTRFPKFTETVFAALPAGVVEDDLPGADSAQQDRVLVERAVRFLRDRDPARPCFLVLFLDATHLPYAFAPESIRYRPFTEHLYYTELNTPVPREPVYNRYRNAVADVDGSLGKVLQALEASGQEPHTIVVLTGDHGQEFFEHGALGHNIALDGPQTAVPLILELPGLAAGDVPGRTRGVDIVPTLLERLGVENPPGDYSLGHALPGGAGHGPTVMCGMVDCAVLDEDGSTTVFDPRDPLAPPRVRDPDWRPAPGDRASKDLPDVRRQLRAFLE